MEIQLASREDKDLTSTRIHELAILAWLNSKFKVKGGGYPVPVIFATPMDAFAAFDKLISIDNGPYAYLKKQPYPANVRYPLISVNRRGWAYRPSQNYSLRVDRRFGWPTVSGLADGLAREDIAHVEQRQMPMAWDFSYQLDHYSNRPEGQALFVERLFRSVAYGTAGEPQTWLVIAPPGYPRALVRATFSGFTDSSEKEPNEAFMVYRTTVDVKVEGWSYDFDRVIVPAVWNLVVGAHAVAPEVVEQIYALTDYPLSNATFNGEPLPRVQSYGTIIAPDAFAANDYLVADGPETPIAPNRV